MDQSAEDIAAAQLTNARCTYWISTHRRHRRRLGQAAVRAALVVMLDELLAEGERTSYPAGTTIYQEGDALRAVLVIDGLLRVYMTSAKGRQVTVRYARDADVLGIALRIGEGVNRWLGGVAGPREGPGR